MVKRPLYRLEVNQNSGDVMIINPLLNRDRKFECLGIDFDGAIDYALRGADLTGNANAKTGLVSFWINFDSNGTKFQIQYCVNGRIDFFRDTDNKMYFRAYDTGAVEILKINSSAILAAAGWTHIEASWDLATSTEQIYVNGVSDVTVVTSSDVAIDYTNNEHALGASHIGNNKYDGDLSEYYFTNTHLDLSVADNLAKLINEYNKPVNLGDDGSLVTGTQPLVYFSVREGDAASAFFTNKGSGGDYTDQGSVVLSATSPSD